MPKEKDKRDLTLGDLWKQAQQPGHDAFMDGSPEAIKWTRTLVMQIHMIAGLFGVTLPKPIVDEGVRINWKSEKYRMELRTIVIAPKLKELGADSPREYGGFSFIRLGIWIPKEVGLADRTKYLGIDATGSFNPDIFFNFIADWPLMMDKPDDPTSEENRRPYPFQRRDGYIVYFELPPTISENVHQVVRDAFNDLKDDVDEMVNLKLTLDQMRRLYHGWDGLDARPPSKEEIDTIGSVIENVRTAGAAIGEYFPEPCVYLHTDREIIGDPPDVIPFVIWYFPGARVALKVHVEPDFYDIDVHFEPAPSNNDAAGEESFTIGIFVPRIPGKSVFDVLREIFY
jgi:hypothetical protein